MKKKWIVISMMTAIVFAASFAAISFADIGDQDVRSGTIRVTDQSEADFPNLSKIGALQAIMTAMEKVNGKLLKMGLENENGFLVYDVEVVTPDKSIMDITVDAGSGAVLSVEKDHEDRDTDKRDESRENNDGADSD